jgi:hypothetical protein
MTRKYSKARRVKSSKRSISDSIVNITATLSSRGARVTSATVLFCVFYLFERQNETANYNCTLSKDGMKENNIRKKLCRKCTKKNTIVDEI